MGTYKIVYRDEAGTDRKAFTAFEDNATIEENLVRIVPNAVGKGLLHPEATPQNVLVEHDGVRLNPKLPLKEAAPGIKENEDIVVRYITSSINFQMLLEADNPDDQRKIFFGRRKMLCIKETLTVNPSEQLASQIEGKLDEIRGRHRFFGRTVKDAKQFKLRAHKKSLIPNLSLAEQGFDTDLEVKVKPRIWLDWPPCFYFGLRGPYTGYLITLGILLPVIVLIVLLTGADAVPRFHTVFDAPFECNIKVDGQPAFATVEDGKPRASIAAGMHTIWVYPKERPIHRRSLLLERRVRGGISESDSMWTVDESDSLWSGILPDTPDTLVERTSIRIVGYEGAADYNNLQVNLKFNGFSYPVDDDLTWEFDLVPGDYEFKLGLEDDLLLTSRVRGDGNGVSGNPENPFVFTVAEDTLVSTIVFRYNVPRRE